MQMLLRQRLEATGWGEEKQDYLSGTCASLVVHMYDCLMMLDIMFSQVGNGTAVSIKVPLLSCAIYAAGAALWSPLASSFSILDLSISFSRCMVVSLSLSSSLSLYLFLALARRPIICLCRTCVRAMGQLQLKSVDMQAVFLVRVIKLTSGAIG